jgi:predicted amidophosphoribosyltransferase
VAPPLWTDVDITAGAAGGHYEGALRDIIHAYKYEGRRSLARPLGRLMRNAGAALLEDADCIIPVPLHPWRRMTRGFNQAADLAKELARTLDRPVVHALWRARSTPPQMALSARARRINVRDAFILSPWFVRRAALSWPTKLGARSRHGPPIENRIVVLVDDVRTTGATLNACAKVLKSAGVREVRALTVAIADPPEGRVGAGL